MLKVEYVRNEDDRAQLEVWLDGEYWRNLSGRIFRRLKGLPRSCESEKALSEWFAEEEAKRARNGAYKLLAAQALNSKQLSERLERWGYRPEVVQAVVTRVVEQGYINDAEWALSYAKGLKRRRYGRQYVSQRLWQKGITGELCQSVLSELYDEGGGSEIQELLQTRYKNRDLSDQKELRKVVAALCRRGFGAQQVWEAVSEAAKLGDTQHDFPY